MAKYLAFTSSRPGPRRAARSGSSSNRAVRAFQLTDLKGPAQGYEWSPDSKRFALVVGDPDPEADAEPAAGGRRVFRSPSSSTATSSKQDGGAICSPAATATSTSSTSPRRSWSA